MSKVVAEFDIWIKNILFRNNENYLDWSEEWLLISAAESQSEHWARVTLKMNVWVEAELKIAMDSLIRSERQAHQYLVELDKV